MTVIEREAASAPPLTLAGWARASAPSAIQSMLAAGTAPGTLSFALGLPARELFPTEALGRALAESLAEEAMALQYAPPQARLREQVATLMERRGVACTPEQVLLTAGAQQGISLVARLLLEPGGEVLAETLCYTGFQQAVEPLAPRYLTVPTCPDTGMDVDAVERLLAGGARPALVYCVPEGHNPMAVRMSAQKRARLAELAREYAVAVVEDDPYGFLQYDGPPPAALRALDGERVFYLGSFSKVLAPSLRVGWIVAPAGTVPLLATLKESSDINTATLAQRAVSRYLAGGGFPAHLERLCREYRLRRDAMLDALEACFPAGARWRCPPSGVFVWVELPEQVDAAEVLRVAIDRERVVFFPGHAFAADGSRTGSNCMRLNFSNSPPAEIREGVARLARALRAAGA